MRGNTEERTLHFKNAKDGHIRKIVDDWRCNTYDKRWSPSRRCRLSMIGKNIDIYDWARDKKFFRRLIPEFKEKNGTYTQGLRGRGHLYCADDFARVTYPECTSGNYSKENPCHEWLSKSGWCGNTYKHRFAGTDCRPVPNLGLVELHEGETEESCRKKCEDDEYCHFFSIGRTKDTVHRVCYNITGSAGESSCIREWRYGIKGPYDGQCRIYKKECQRWASSEEAGMILRGASQDNRDGIRTNEYYVDSKKYEEMKRSVKDHYGLWLKYEKKLGMKSYHLRKYRDVFGDEFNSSEEAKRRCTNEGYHLCRKTEVIVGATTCKNGWTSDGGVGCDGNKKWSPNGKASAHCCDNNPSDCSENQYLKDGKCELIPTCSENQWLNNNECKDHTTCSDTQVEARKPDSRRDRTCRDRKSSDCKDTEWFNNGKCQTKMSQSECDGTLFKTHSKEKDNSCYKSTFTKEEEKLCSYTGFPAFESNVSLDDCKAKCIDTPNCDFIMFRAKTQWKGREYLIYAEYTIVRVKIGKYENPNHIKRVLQRMF